MACSLANNFSHPLHVSFSMKDSMLFVGCHGNLVQSDSSSGSDDALGELREEEIVWGEAEIHHHHYIDTSSHEADRGGNCKEGMTINNSGDHRPLRHRSLLSRQIEMQAKTWSAGSTISTVRIGAAKQSANSRVVAHDIKTATDHQNQEVGNMVGVMGGSSGKEDSGMQQQMNELIPPHELLARQYAASAATSFSVVQGAGRTLKGRDLRRLRNEVWRQTGFVD